MICRIVLVLQLLVSPLWLFAADPIRSSSEVLAECSGTVLNEVKGDEDCLWLRELFEPLFFGSAIELEAGVASDVQALIWEFQDTYGVDQLFFSYDDMWVVGCVGVVAGESPSAGVLYVGFVREADEQIRANAYHQPYTRDTKKLGTNRMFPHMYCSARVLDDLDWVRMGLEELRKDRAARTKEHER